MGIKTTLAMTALKLIAGNADMLKDISMPNIPAPTLGGKVFWNTIAYEEGWKLQQNQITHHVRLLDPNNIRVAWGGENEMKRLLNQILEASLNKERTQVNIGRNESLDAALKRFKRSCAKDGVIAEVRKREHYEKPSVKRKKKSEAARKRKY